jgi:phage terminase large subunit
MNTPDIHHFIVRRYFNCFPVTVEDEPNFTQEELDGYFKIVPKGLEGIVCIQSSFRDNVHLPEKIVRKYNWYGERNDEGRVNDLHHYMTSIQGYSTTGLKGQIFRNYKVISLEEYNSLDYYEVYGVDFGTASPAGVVAVKVRNNNVYVRQLNYEPLSVIPLGKKLDKLGIKSRDLIIADCAEPDSIRELRFGFKKYFDSEERERYPEATKGFRNCLASPDKSIRAGIDKLLSMNIYVTEDSVDLLNELLMYVWDTDRDGKCLDKPIDDWNHLIDPLRYVIRGARVWGRDKD